MRARTARHYAWLLRPDVRKSTKSEQAPNEAFQGWWLVRGRVEYPACDSLSEDEIQWLREPVGKLTLAPGVTLPVPRAMKLTLQYRPDVRQKRASNPLALAGWFFSSGLHEHRLLRLVDADWVRHLDTALRAKGDAGPAPWATWLMTLTWHLLEPAQQAALPLAEPAARLKFMGMFFEAAARSPSLTALLARRWHIWLEQDESRENGRPQPRWRLIGMRSRPVWSPARADESEGTTPSGMAAPAPAIHWRDRPFGVNLYGFAFGELGIGEDVRMAVKACEAAGIPHRVVNVDPGAQLRQADRALAEHVQRSAEASPFAFNIFCMPGFDMVGRVLMREGQGLLEGHCNIGWWPWELPVWPRRWKPAFDLVDEVWAATWYTEAMYRAATDKPVTWMPLPAAVDRVQPMTRQALGLPPRRFLYLFVFDLNSWLPRKNPWAVIDAFQRAFPPPAGKVRPAQAQVSLVLKTMNGRDGHPVWEAFKQRCAEDPRIVLMDKTLDRDQVLGLIQACDAYVSLHRAEGFGRTLAEAMLLGKPVVATDFSGSTDFLDQTVGFPVRWARKAVEPGDYLFVEPDDEAWWAEADVEHAAQQLRAAKASAKNAAFRAHLNEHATEVFSPVRIGAQMQRRLLQMWEAGR